MNIHTGLIRSQSFDPWHNLALEEMLLRDVSPGEIVLYLWQNQNTVVIGRNQNAWQECRWKELEADGGKLARRLSGGGAVYHDTGNLNFTFIMDKKLYHLKRQLNVVLEAVRSLGIEAEFSGRNDILAEGRKFSGNAFHNNSYAAYHHGTLLVDVDFEKLGQYLNVSEEKIKSKGITSVKSRVVNLSQLNEGINIENLADAMNKSFIDEYGGDGKRLRLSEITSDLSPLYDKYSSWEWRYGHTPKFDVSFSNRFDWGGIEVGFSLKDGQIIACTVFSDAMDSRLIQDVASRMEQIPFRHDAITAKLSEILTDDNGQMIVADIDGWMSTLNI